ncbi:MAG: hypothetical protein ACE5MG_11335 [Candidatus Methylomirabilales bacterium]
MRYILTALVLAAMAVTPSLAVAVGGGGCASGHASIATSPTPQKGTSEKTQQEAKAPQGDRDERQEAVDTKSDK